MQNAYMPEKYNQKFIMYEGIWEAIKTLPQEYQFKAISAVMDYGFHENFHEDDPIISALMKVIAPNILNAKRNYNNKKRTNHEKIIELRTKGCSISEIANRMNCSIRTVQRHLNDYK